MCKEELSVEQFKKNSHHKDGLQSQCIECQRQYRREHYLKNRAKYIFKTHEAKKARVLWFKDFKSNLACIKCGEDHPACIDFHHPEGGKKGDVSKMVRCASQERLLEEIDKCDVLCANCHRKEHWVE
jgi:hypothetical protein